MNQRNSEQLNRQTNLDVDFKENELSDDDLDVVSGGYPGYTLEQEGVEHHDLPQTQAWQKYDGNNILTTFNPQTGQPIKTAPDGASWRQ